MPDTIVEELMTEHDFSDGSISFLKDKGFEDTDFKRLYDAMELPNQTFDERRKNKDALEILLDRGDAKEITTGRYERYVDSFADISSEQALVKGRMKFAIEYVIALADQLDESNEKDIIEEKFSDDEKATLRFIYENYRTKDYAAVKIIERKTKHDIVAANTWVTIRAQQEGLDENLMRKITHFARTSEDVNANVIGELYTEAIERIVKSYSNLLLELEKRAEMYAEVSYLSQTHGQFAQMSTVGHIYAILANKIGQHAMAFLGDEKLKLDGKIAGAIGTDVDMKAAYPNIDFNPMYKYIVEDIFGLNYVRLGNDQASTNAYFAQAFDSITNMNSALKKSANDLWSYASRGIIAKKTKKGESGSSAMPQKANPFLLEGSEALVGIINAMFAPIKDSLIAYRGQGDLRRSITMREAFHPAMLSVIAVERVIEELDNYEPNIIALEQEVDENGLKIISSCISTRLKKSDVPDAYDRIKEFVMKPNVEQKEIDNYINELVDKKTINYDDGETLKNWCGCVIDTEGLVKNAYTASDTNREKYIEKLITRNKDPIRKELMGDAIPLTYEMIEESQKTRELLSRYIS